MLVKEKEREYRPAEWWERIELPAQDTEEAQRIIEEKLQYWPGFTVGTCKERVAKIHEYLRRMRQLREDNEQPILSTVKGKAIKRDKRREERALKVAGIETKIEKELMERLKKGVYGQIYNIPQRDFEKVVQKTGRRDVLEEEDEHEYQRMAEFIEAESEEESDIEDAVVGGRRTRPRIEREHEYEAPARTRELVRRRK